MNDTFKLMKDYMAFGHSEFVLTFINKEYEGNLYVIKNIRVGEESLGFDYIDFQQSSKDWNFAGTLRISKLDNYSVSILTEAFKLLYM